MKRLLRTQLANSKSSLGSNPVNRFGFRRCARGGKVRADQPVAICRVKGKPVRIDQKTHHDSEKQQDSREQKDNEELYARPWSNSALPQKPLGGVVASKVASESTIEPTKLQSIKAQKKRPPLQAEATGNPAFWPSLWASLDRRASNAPAMPVTPPKAPRRLWPWCRLAPTREKLPVGFASPKSPGHPKERSH